MKKIILAIIVIVVASTILSACGNKNRSYKASIIDTDPALLSIFTYDGKGESTYGLANLGHSFLTIENISEEPFYLANKKVEAGETVAFGTWSILDHFGVWYNVESNYIDEYNKYDGRVSVTQSVTLEDIDAMSEYIYEHDTWNPLTNCSCFALNIWNLVSHDDEILDKLLIYTPTKIANQLKQFDTYEINKEIITDDEFGYFDKSEYVFYHLEGVEV